MRRVRSRLTILLFSLVIGTSVLSLVFSALVRRGILFRRGDFRFLIFGFALKDILLLGVTIALTVAVVLLTSRSTVNPIVQLNRATREIAAGNFDITVDIQDRVEEFGELERSFNRMAAELRSNEYLRKDFISNVSHELRTPLSIVHGYAELLAEGGLSESEQQEYARYIAAESDRLSRLTGDMLRLSRMDHNELRPRADRFSLDEQLRQVILRLEPRWSTKRLELELELEPVDFTGDEELLGQVWGNLLDNAIKFTPDGGQIAVTLRAAEGRAVARVADSGIGMTDAVLARIFEQFYRGDPSRKSEGSGLGLPLARRIVELHGGTIAVASAPGGGSAFTVSLPRC